jgi:hypothetical protein
MGREKRRPRSRTNKKKEEELKKVDEEKKEENKTNNILCHLHFFCCLQNIHSKYIITPIAWYCELFSCLYRSLRLSRHA